MRERTVVEDHLCVLGFTFSIGAHSIYEEVAGFFLYGFQEENYFCFFSLVIIDVHVIL